MRNTRVKKLLCLLMMLTMLMANSLPSVHAEPEPALIAAEGLTLAVDDGSFYAYLDGVLIYQILLPYDGAEVSLSIYQSGDYLYFSFYSDDENNSTDYMIEAKYGEQIQIAGNYKEITVDPSVILPDMKLTIARESKVGALNIAAPVKVVIRGTVEYLTTIADADVSSYTPVEVADAAAAVMLETLKEHTEQRIQRLVEKDSIVNLLPAVAKTDGQSATPVPATAPAPTAAATPAPTGAATPKPTGDATPAPTGDATPAPTEPPLVSELCVNIFHKHDDGRDHMTSKCGIVGHYDCDSGWHAPIECGKPGHNCYDGSYHK